MRKVMIKAWVPCEQVRIPYTTVLSTKPGTGCWEEGYSIEGKFHEWGSKFEEFDTGPGNYTVGIIELQSGQIVETEPSAIKFVD